MRDLPRPREKIIKNSTLHKSTNLLKYTYRDSFSKLYSCPLTMTSTWLSQTTKGRVIHAHRVREGKREEWVGGRWRGASLKVAHLTDSRITVDPWPDTFQNQQFPRESHTTKIQRRSVEDNASGPRLRTFLSYGWDIGIYMKIKITYFYSIIWELKVDRNESLDPD